MILSGIHTHPIVVACDRCTEELKTHSHLESTARRRAAERGWTSVDEVDFCPSCTDREKATHG